MGCVVNALILPGKHKKSSSQNVTVKHSQNPIGKAVIRHKKSTPASKGELNTKFGMDDVNHIRKLYASYVNKMRDQRNLEPLEVSGQLNRLALRVNGKTKFCGKTMSSPDFQSYEINCLTWPNRATRRGL